MVLGHDQRFAMDGKMENSWDWFGTGTGFRGTKHEETAQEETLE